MKTYRVKKIFGPTLQGEGSASGRVVNFLRLAGCNRWTGLEKDREKSICKFCDTDFRGGEPLAAGEVVAALDALGSCRRVVISGGEPTLQIDEELLSALTNGGYKLHLETNGSRALGDLARFFAHVTMSPKQSFVETKLERCTDLKILYPPISPAITHEEFAAFEAEHRYLQPVWDAKYENNLKATVGRVYGNPTWRLSLQTHKILGVE